MKALQKVWQHNQITTPVTQLHEVERRKKSVANEFERRSCPGLQGSPLKEGSLCQLGMRMLLLLQTWEEVMETLSEVFLMVIRQAERFQSKHAKCNHVGARFLRWE